MKYEGLNELISMNVLSVLQDSELIQNISFLLTILVAVTTLVLNIVRSVKIAKMDGVITPEEVKDIADTVKDGVSNVIDTINKEGEDNVK